MSCICLLPTSIFCTVCCRLRLTTSNKRIRWWWCWLLFSSVSVCACSAPAWRSYLLRLAVACIFYGATDKNLRRLTISTAAQSGSRCRLGAPSDGRNVHITNKKPGQSELSLLYCSKVESTSLSCLSCERVRVNQMKLETQLCSRVPEIASVFTVDNRVHGSCARAVFTALALTAPNKLYRRPARQWYAGQA